MLNIEVINNIKRLESLREPWNEALSRSEVDDVHLTWEWCYTWYKNFAKDSLFILAAWDKDRILAIAPLMTRRYLMGSRLMLENIGSHFFDIILTEREDECVSAIFESALKEKWDFLNFTDLPAESRSAALIESLADRGVFQISKGKQEGISPYVPSVGSADAYFRGLSSRFMKNIRYVEKKLKDKGKISVLEVRDPESVKVYLEKFFRIEADGWKGRLRTSILDSKEKKNFYTELAYLASQRGWLSLYFLKLDDREIAADYCLNYRNVMNLQKTGYDSEYARYSPGCVLRKRVLEEAFNGDFTESRFIGVYYGWDRYPNDTWKLKWKPLTRRFTQFYIYKKSGFSSLMKAVHALRGFFKKSRFLVKIKRAVFDAEYRSHK
ncbi:MAG: GNAT family N-acetyltransferase [Candidatus Omnitrophota bacterium]